jgi:hypothetical protein
MMPTRCAKFLEHFIHHELTAEEQKGKLELKYLQIRYGEWIRHWRMQTQEIAEYPAMNL